LEGVDNADPASGESFKASTRSLFRGKALAVVRSSRKPGTLKLQASVAGTKPAVLEIKTQAITAPVSVTEEPPAEVESLFLKALREGKTGLPAKAVAAAGAAVKPESGKPEPFAFQPLAQGDMFTFYESNTIVVKGLSGPAPIAISEKNSDAAYSINVKNGDRVQVKVMSGSTGKTKFFLKLNIGGQVAEYSVNTK
jgi:Glycoside hydrolase family 2 C-terminal domain 5